ncbi:hypothetical protein XENOCAPTIV_016847, partial [Xenoophorus captivus]
VCVQNMSDMNFTLAEVKLTEKQHLSLELQSFNTKTNQASSTAAPVWSVDSR